MSTGFFKVPKAKNEIVKSYIPGSKERKDVHDMYKKMISSFTEVPMYINGKDVRSNNKKTISPPHDHQKIVGEYYVAEPKHIDEAIESALAAKNKWEKLLAKPQAAVIKLHKKMPIETIILRLFSSESFAMGIPIAT